MPILLNEFNDGTFKVKMYNYFRLKVHNLDIQEIIRIGSIHLFYLSTHAI